MKRKKNNKRQLPASNFVCWHAWKQMAVLSDSWNWHDRATISLVCTHSSLSSVWTGFHNASKICRTQNNRRTKSIRCMQCLDPINFTHTHTFVSQPWLTFFIATEPWFQGSHPRNVYLKTVQFSGTFVLVHMHSPYTNWSTLSQYWETTIFHLSCHWGPFRRVEGSSTKSCMPDMSPITGW